MRRDDLDWPARIKAVRPTPDTSCWKCGRPLGQADAFCPSCGAAQQEEPAPRGIIDWKNVLLLCGALLALWMCGVIPRGAGDDDRASPTSAPSSGLAVAARTSTPRPTLPAPGTARSRPLPAGVSIVADNGIELVVLGVDRAEVAWAKIQGYSSWNDPPHDGMEYVLVMVGTRLNRGADETQRISKSYFRIVGERGAIHQGSSLTLGKEFAPELFGGGSCEGEVAFEVEQGEGDLVLIYSGTGTEARYLALED